MSDDRPAVHVNLVFHRDAFQIVYDGAPERPGPWIRFGHPGGFTEWDPMADAEDNWCTCRGDHTCEGHRA